MDDFDAFIVYQIGRAADNMDLDEPQVMRLLQRVRKDERSNMLQALEDLKRVSSVTQDMSKFLDAIINIIGARK